MARSNALPSLLSNDPIQRGMFVAILEGCLFSVWNSAVGGNFLTGMALYLGAGGFALGLLAALPSISPMLQIISAPFVVGMKNRRNFLANFSALQRFGGAVAGLLALFLMPSKVALILFVGMQLVAWACMAPSTVVWQGYMSDLVPVDYRGRYFARRNAWGSAVGMSTVLAFGWILDHNQGAPGFRILYLIALVAAALNFASWFLLPELPQGDTRSNRPFWESISIPLTKAGPHRTAAFFFAAWAFAQGMAAPFYSVALIKNLGLSFSVVSMLATLSAITAIVTLGLWGRLQDRIGQARTISVLAAMLAAVPLLFLAAQWALWPALVLAHIVQGTAANGMGLANQTLMMKVVPTEDRSSYFAFFAAAGGLTGFFTPLLVGPLTTNYLNVLFIAAAVASALLALLWRYKLQARIIAQIAEVR